MTIQDAYNFLEAAKASATRKQDIKTYERFLHILTVLKKKELSTEETQSIEATLDSLNINSNTDNRNKHIKKALRKFEAYLNEKFSFVSEGYYMSLGIGLGASLGTSLGIVFMNSFDNSSAVGIGVAIGTGLGIAIGSSMDAKAKAAEKVL